MKTILALLLCPVLLAAAQTNAPAPAAPKPKLHPEYVKWLGYTNTIAVLKGQVKKLEDANAAQAKRLEQDLKARYISSTEYWSTQRRLHGETAATTEPLKLQIARLEVEAERLDERWGWSKLKPVATATNFTTDFTTVGTKK